MGKRTYNVNDDFFKKDSEESFYWAGFLAADGCLYYKKLKYGESFRIQLGLCGADVNQIEMFKKSIEAKNQVKIYIDNKGYYHSVISICSKIMFFDLMQKFLLTPRKTHSHIFPDWLKDHPLVKHFIRGYFDGDGGFYKNISGKTHQFDMRICGTPAFLEQVREILVRDCGVSDIPKPYMYNGQGVLGYNGNDQGYKLAKYLYSDANIYMQRKYNEYLYLSKLVAYPNKPTKEQIIEAYKRLGSCSKIGKEFNYSCSAISYMMRKMDLTHLQKDYKQFDWKKSGITKENLLSAYEELISPVKIADKFGCTVDNVYRLTTKFGYEHLLPGHGPLNRSVLGNLNNRKNND